MLKSILITDHCNAFPYTHKERVNVLHKKGWQNIMKSRIINDSIDNKTQTIHSIELTLNDTYLSHLERVKHREKWQILLFCINK